MKKAKTQKAKKSQERYGKKQRHTRIKAQMVKVCDDEDINTDDESDREYLIANSVACGSSKTYNAALNTLKRNAALNTKEDHMQR